MKAVILAAGLGTRLRPWTLTTAKAALPFCNVPLLGYSVHLLESLGIQDWVCNLHHLPETVEASLQKLKLPHQHVLFSRESPKILGSGGALWQMQDKLQGADDILLINADTVFFPGAATTLTDFVRVHREEGALATLLTIDHPDVGQGFGGVYCRPEPLSVLGMGAAPAHSSAIADVRNSPGESGGGDEMTVYDTVRFSKSSIANLVGLHFTGIAILSHRLLAKLPQGESNLLYDVLQQAIAEGERVVSVKSQNSLWYETGDPNSYIRSTKAALSLLRSPNNFVGQFFQQVLHRCDPGWDNIKIDSVYSHQAITEDLQVDSAGITLIGANFKFNQRCRLRGFNVLHRHTHLEGDTQLEDCVSVAPCRIGAGIHQGQIFPFTPVIR